MFRTVFHHVCNFEVIIPEYHPLFYHLISWCCDSLCSSLEPAVFIVLRNFESPGNFVILLITHLYVLFFNIVYSKSPGKNPCVWKAIIYLLLSAQVFNLLTHRYLLCGIAYFSTVNIWSGLDTCIRIYMKIDSGWYYMMVWNY